MISLGLTSAEQKQFHEVLASSHSVNVVVRVMDKDRAYLADVSDAVYDGQVNIDADADITRTATLSLRDADHGLMFDSNSPSDAGLFVDRMVSIVYVVTAAYPLKLSYSVPIFAGPITKVARSADIISVEASGMEHLMFPPSVAWFTKSYAKGIRITTLLKTMLGELAGETKFSIPDWPGTTAKATTTVFNSNVWAVAKKLVGSRSTNHLYYDGRGVCTLRKTPQAPCFTFTTGHKGNVVTEPQISYDMADVANTVRVTGVTKPKAKTPVHASATAPRSHPLSTYSLGRNGKQRVILAELSDDTLKTEAACKQLATTHLEKVLRETVTVTFDSLVIPHLEPEDIFTLRTDDISLEARVKQMTIPLKGGTMTVGYNAKRSVNRAKIR